MPLCPVVSGRAALLWDVMPLRFVRSGRVRSRRVASRRFVASGVVRWRRAAQSGRVSSSKVSPLGRV